MAGTPSELWEEDEDGNIIAHADVSILGNDFFSDNTNQAILDIASIEAGLARTDTIFVSASGNDASDGLRKDTPVQTLDRARTLILASSFSAGGQVRCEDHSDFNEELEGATGIDFILPEASVTGIDLRNATNTIVKVRANVGDGTGNMEGQYVVQIDHMNITYDIFDEVRGNLNVVGYAVTDNGHEYQYGNQGHYVSGVDASFTLDFHRPVVLFRNTTIGKTATLPSASSAPLERHGFKFTVINHPFSGNGNDMTVNIESSEVFEKGFTSWTIEPNSEREFELIRTPEGSYWKINDDKHFLC